MIINWIGRVFGRGHTSPSMAAMAPGALVGDFAAPATTIVESDELADELARARRYERDLSLVVMSASPTVRESENGGRLPSAATKLPQMIALLTAVALREVVRQSDVVCYQPAENRFVLALAESDEASAQSAVDRITAHFDAHLRLRVRAGVARFPADAYTLDELVAKAAERVATRAAVAGSNVRTLGRFDTARRRPTRMFGNGDAARSEGV
jgi:hypothetical protein